MFKIFLIFFPAVMFVSACTTGAAPAPDTPEPEQFAAANTQVPVPTKTLVPTQPPPTPTPDPSPSFTPKPTIDLALVLTPETTVAYEVDYIGLKTSDDVQIMAKQFGEGEPVVILAHQGTTGANQRDWEAFARLLAGRGCSAATLDFRGRGQSKGDMTSTNLLIRDMRALIDRLQEDGYQRFVCMGASMGGSTCLRAAVEYDLEGLVVIGSLMSNGDPTTTSPEELAALAMPKLFITTENDRYEPIPAAVKDMYEIAQDPKQFSVFPGEAHGTEMFDQPYGEEFTAELVAFVEMLR